MLTSLDKYFFEWQFVDAVLEHDDFLKIYFTR